MSRDAGVGYVRVLLVPRVIDNRPGATFTGSSRSIRHRAGAKTANLPWRHAVSEATIYNWKSKYGGLEVSEARWLEALESENAKLKRLLADAMLDTVALKDLLAKKFLRPARGGKLWLISRPATG